MKNNRNIKRRGFTLVELLIVIVVIGVLSAMMMLSSTEAVSSARASNIVSNLRNLKTAALAWYADHLDAVSGDFKLENQRTAILKYMNNETVDAAYKFVGTKADESWYVYYEDTNMGANISGKLASRAESVGLFKDDKGHTSSNKYVAQTSGYKVYMFVR